MSYLKDTIPGVWDFYLNDYYENEELFGVITLTPEGRFSLKYDVPDVVSKVLYSIIGDTIEGTWSLTEGSDSKYIHLRMRTIRADIWGMLGGAASVVATPLISLFDMLSNGYAKLYIERYSREKISFADDKWWIRRKHPHI